METLISFKKERLLERFLSAHRFDRLDEWVSVGCWRLDSRGGSMASRLNPYLSFDGTARQAMEFYQGVFGGDLNFTTFGQYDQGSSQEHAPEADKIMHSILAAQDLTLMGADTPPGIEFKPGNTMAVSLSGDNAEELRRYWEKLSEGGTVSVPLEKQMWGDVFGMCQDRFGVGWMVNISPSQQ
jgi:PhnB protein